MINSYRRVPQWEVEIRRPDYTSSGKVTFERVTEWGENQTTPSSVRFVSRKTSYNSSNTYFDLIGYEYNNSIGNPEGSFSLTFTPRIDNNGYSWYDKLQSRDFVIIKEFGETRYVGLIKNIGYSSSIPSGNPERNVVISGCSFGGIVQTFNLPMNTYLWAQGGTADSFNKDLIKSLNSEVKEQQDLSGLLKTITEKFYAVVFGGQEIKGTINLFKEFSLFSADQMLSAYPQIFSVFQVESNNLWQIYREILPSPVYEILGRYDSSYGKYRIVCRETPFDQFDWVNIRKTDIDPLYLVSQNLNFSDNEVYTHYCSTMPNAAFSENESYANYGLSEVSYLDEDKLYIYGYNQLRANFKFFNSLDKDTFNAKQFLKDNSERMYEWYKNNKDFSSGTIELMNVPDSLGRMIEIGERVGYLSGEFYVEGYKRSMQYPGTMKSSLAVTRGFEYDSNGKQVQPIRRMAQKMVNTERDVVNYG